MRKFRIAAVIALVMSVFALSGCDMIKELSYNKWCTKKVTVKEQPVDVYFYWATKDAGKLKSGLNVVVMAKGEAVTIMGEELTSGKYYIIKNIPDGSTVDSIDDSELDEKFAEVKNAKITSGRWAACYATMFKKESRNVAAPVCLSDSTWETPKDAASFNIKQIIADALLAMLEG